MPFELQLKKRPAIRIAAFAALALWLCLGAVPALADGIPYSSIRPAKSAIRQEPKKPEGQKPAEKPQEPVAVESPTHPEFVRLPDGRIVKYGPGIICEEVCTEPVPPKTTTRRTRAGAPIWFVVPPLAAGALACAILCGSGETTSRPPIVIPPGPTVSPTPPPPAEIPEPGTIVLLSIGLGAVAAKKLAGRRR